MQPVIYNWTVPSTTAVAALQNLGAAGSLVLNGSLSTGSGNIYIPNMVRAISLTSTNNLSGVNFTINGSSYGTAISETIAGPNNNTVQTTEIFDTVTSITTNGAVNAVSAGIGSIGSTPWMWVDCNKMVLNVAVNVYAVGTINYTLQTTIVQEGDVLSGVGTLSPVTALTNATASQGSSFSIPCTHARIYINSSGANGVIQAQFLQQGIR